MGRRGAAPEGEPVFSRDMLRFARRHGIVPYASGVGEPADLDLFLGEARRLGFERTWIEVGPGKEMTVLEFVRDSVRREPVLERFRELARTYRRHYPDFARITLFDEAPLGAFRSPGQGGARSYFRDAALFREHGPEAFAHLYRAIKSEMPNAEVGIFLHHPHNAPPSAAGEHSWIDAFMHRADSLSARPDFIYSDIYRGYFARGYGTEATDRYVRDVVAHIDSVAERWGADAYQLGQIHTIKIGYTPSRWEIDTNVDALLAGGADGIGWYWPNYAATDQVAPGEAAGHDVSFDPFVPNAWGALRPAGSMFGTSRDRWSYGFLRALEATGRLDPSERFDLWLYGHDLDAGEHRVYAQTAAGEWELLGHVNAQHDRSGYHDAVADSAAIYSYADRWHAVVFHALRRDRFLAPSGELRLRIETLDGSDGAELAAAYAVPYRETRNFLTEAEATRLIETQPRWVGIQSLARHVLPRPVALRAGGAAELAAVPVSGITETATRTLPPGEFWRSQVLVDVLPFWTRYGRDAEHGAFHAFLDREWRPYGTGSKFPGMVSRHVFSYAAAYMVTGDEAHLGTAAELVRWMLEHGWDPEHGGWYTEVDRQGRVVDASKDVFMQLYAATGLAMYYAATRDPAARDYADRTIRLLDAHAWDAERGGYFRTLGRDLEVTDSSKTVSAQLAPLSGYLEYLYLATRDTAYLRSAERILDTALAHMRDPATGWVLENFDAAWRPQPRRNRAEPRVSIGHQIETGWMALRLGTLTGRRDYLDLGRAMGERLLDRAYLPDRGVWAAEFELADSTAIGAVVPWWVHAYGNMYQLALYGATGSARHLDAFRGGAAFWNQHLIDPLYGGAFLTVDTAGAVVKGDKGVRTKTSYHTVEHGLLNYLYTNLWATGEPVELFFHVREPRSDERLYPLPVGAPGARIAAVEVNGAAWTDFDADAGWVRLPAGGPARVRVVVAPPAATAASAHRFDLALHGPGLDPATHTVELETNPALGGGWVRLDSVAGAAHVRRGTDGWTTLVFPGLGMHRFLGQDIRENHLRLRVRTRDGAVSDAGLAAIYAFPAGTDDVAALIERDPGAAERASRAVLVYPRPRPLAPGSTLVEHVPAPVRHRMPGVLEAEWLEILYRYPN